MNVNMSDNDYLQSIDVNFFMKHWLQQVYNSKSDINVAEHGAKYFKNVRSCQHVLGQEYSFIASCRYNRRAFVFCIMEALMTVPLEEQYTVIEFQLILDMLCIDMPKQILLDAINHIDPKEGIKETAKYLHKDSRLALFLYIIYEDWIHYVDTFFRDEKSIHTTRLKYFIDQLRVNHANNMEHPPIEALDAVYTNILKSHKEDISDFLKALLQNSIMIEDLCKFPDFAKSLYDTSDNNNNNTNINTNTNNIPSNATIKNEIIEDKN